MESEDFSNKDISIFFAENPGKIPVIFYGTETWDQT